MPPPVQVHYRRIPPPKIGEIGWEGCNPRTETLPSGWQGNGPTARPLPCDIVVDHDYAFEVRDGCKLYCDIYRPAGDNVKVPAIVAWSPFGKRNTGLRVLEHLPWGLGIPEGTLSGLEKFEGPDPAEWIPRGYAIVNVDARGAGASEGDIVIMGQQEGEDGYDVIEQLAKLPWCNGSVGLAGNSHLAIVQWHIASLKPPSLKAIAPWEACSDLYREQFLRGGSFDQGLFDWIIQYMIRGNGGVEDFEVMAKRSKGLMNAYWADKRVDFSKIDVPAFITASHCSFVHTMGSIRGYMQLKGPRWFKVNPWQEWYDLWAEKESTEELNKFFDRYLKEKQNDWEETPRVRTTVLRFGDNDPYFNVAEEDYPLPRTDYRSLYLGAGGKLSTSPASDVGKVSHDSTKPNTFSGFSHTFNETTRLVGIPKAVLYMSCPDHEDMVVYVAIRKLDKDGNAMLSLNIPWSRAKVAAMAEVQKKDHTNLLFNVGFMGVLRASHREIDASQSMHPQFPFHPHTSEQLIPKGEIVKLEIGIWAMGVEFEAGESLSVQVSGSYPLFQEFEAVEHDVKDASANQGQHVVHFGGDYDSRVILPFV